MSDDRDDTRRVKELEDFVLDPDPLLPGRIRRSIERRVLAADSLEFSLDVLIRTLWGYLQTLFEILPAPAGDPKETRDE